MTPRILRAGWGAIPVAADRPTKVASTDGTALHWVGPKVWGDAGSAGRHSLCAGKIRGIQRSHMAGEWYDIAYSEIVCPHGYRYEGRGYHVQTGANGSATGNRKFYAVLALVGQGDKITTELVVALVDAFQAYRDHAGAGRETTTHRVVLKLYAGRTTECPGDYLTALETAGRFMAKPAPAPSPAPSPITTPGGNEMLVKAATSPAVFVTDGVSRRWLPNPTALGDYRAARKAAGLPAASVHEVPTVARLDAAFGPIVGTVPK
jgi:hypothetical protein